MREEVCDQKQLLRAFPLPQMMLPEADPQVPVRTDFRGQAGDRRLSPPKVLYAPPQPHPLRGSAPCSLLSEISCLLPHPTWGLSGDLGPLEPCGCIGTHLPHKNNHTPAPTGLVASVGVALSVFNECTEGVGYG